LKEWKESPYRKPLLLQGARQMAIVDRSLFIENCKKAALEYNWENQEKIILELIK